MKLFFFAFWFLIAVPAWGAPPEEHRLYSCQLYDAERKKCAFGACDKRVVERLVNECLRDGGRP